VLCLYNIHLGKEEEVDEYVVEMVLQDDIEDLEKEKEELMEESEKADPVESHMAFNEAEKPSYGNPEPFKTLEELMEEKEAASTDTEDPTDLSDGEYSERMNELKKKRQKAEQLLGEKEAQRGVHEQPRQTPYLGFLLIGRPKRLPIAPTDLHLYRRRQSSRKYRSRRFRKGNRCRF
jgi:hypothetical protein